MNVNAFISHVRVPLRLALENAVIDVHPTKLRPILNDVDNDIKTRAFLSGAHYRARTPCSNEAWDDLVELIDNMNIQGGVFAASSGGNNNRQVRVLPSVDVVADILDSPWLRANVGQVTNVDGILRFVVLGSIPRSTSVTTTGILVGHSWCGRIPPADVSALNLDGDENNHENISNINANDNANNANNNVNNRVNNNVNDNSDDEGNNNNDTIQTLKVNFDGVDVGVEPINKWKVDRIDKNLKYLNYDVIKFEWKRTWGWMVSSQLLSLA